MPNHHTTIGSAAITSDGLHHTLGFDLLLILSLRKLVANRIRSPSRTRITTEPPAAHAPTIAVVEDELCAATGMVVVNNEALVVDGPDLVVLLWLKILHI